MMTEISAPVDMRGTKLVPAMGLIFGWNPTCEPGIPPWQEPLLNTGHPYSGEVSVAKPSGLCSNCPLLSATSMPKSSKNEKETGPAMGIRYSRLLDMLVSPPIDA